MNLLSFNNVLSSIKRDLCEGARVGKLTRSDIRKTLPAVHSDIKKAMPTVHSKNLDKSLELASFHFTHHVMEHSHNGERCESISERCG